MKFLTFSVLGMLACVQQAEAGFDEYFSSLFSGNLTAQINTAIGSSVPNTAIQNQYTSGLSAGLQSILGSLNIFASPASTMQNPLPTFNFGAQILPNSNIPTQQGNLMTDFMTNPSTFSWNPLDLADPTKWLVFDNQKQFCFSPRVWDGQSCKCPSGGLFLSGKCYYEKPVQVNKDLLSLRFINRNFDGTQNNPNNPTWGAKSSELFRMCPANYEDGKGKILQNLPNPRDICNLVGDTEGKVVESKLGLNMIFTVFGQLIDHDISHTPSTNGQNMNIRIPKCDKSMDKSCTGKQSIAMKRSIISSRNDVRTQVNVITPWIDANFVYGSDKETANNLREFKNGKLRTSEGNLLPKDKNGFFVAGDTRSNQNVCLTILHTVFMREHNRLCDIILAKNPTLTDEEVYQIARNYVIGLVQHITYDEYLPALLGRAYYDAFIGPYKYDPTSNPNTFNQFSTAAFRVGHPMVNGPFKLMDNFGFLIKSLQAGQIFFKPNLLTGSSLDQFMNGMIRMGSKQRSLTIIDELINFLIQTPSSQVKIDLFSFNIQRSRDHGTCSLGVTRQKLGLPKKAFKDLFEDQAKASILEKIFHDPSNVDLWLGIIGEKSEPGSVLGELGIRLNALQFKLMRNGDKFWYEGVYPELIVKEIKATSFADIIKRNTGIKLINFDAFKKLF